MTPAGIQNTKDSQHSRRSFLKTSASAVGGLTLAMDSTHLECLAGEGGVPAGHSPNLVVVLGEGVRHDEFSCTGNSIIHPPHQDQLGGKA